MNTSPLDKIYDSSVDNLVDLTNTNVNITNKYAVIGTHGVGKTGIVSYLEFYFKQLSQVSEVLPEIARYAAKAGIPINDLTTIKAQQTLQTMQKINERDAQKRFQEGKVQHIICDRSVIDNYIYALYRYGIDAKTQMYDQMINWTEVNPYKHIFKMPLWNINDKITADGVRSQDKTFQISIDTLLIIKLGEAKIKYHNIPHEIFTLPADEQTKQLRIFFDDKFGIVR